MLSSLTTIIIPGWCIALMAIKSQLASAVDLGDPQEIELGAGSFESAPSF